MTDRFTAWLRTVVPALWGSLVAWLLSLADYPEWTAPLTDALASEGAAVLVTGAAIGAWYALARWLEPRIPDWLTRIVLGAAATPTYGRD